MLSQPVTLRTRHVVVVRWAVHIARSVVRSAPELRHVHAVLATKGVSLEVRHVVGIDALVVVHVPSRADAALQRVRTGGHAAFANVRVVVPSECRPGVNHDADQSVFVVVGS